jgi:hypothetical protein
MLRCHHRCLAAVAVALAAVPVAAEPTPEDPTVDPPPPPDENDPPDPPKLPARELAPRSADSARNDPKPARPRTAVEITAAPGKGFTVAAGDAFSFNLRLRAQLRYQLHVPPADVADDRKPDEVVQVGTVRAWLSGTTLSPRLTYMIQLALADRDYRDGAISPIFDAFVDYKAHRDLAIRVGQFFVPFDRLRTVREFALQLADRPRPVNELTLDRDVGIVAYSERVFDSPLAYRVGLWGGNGTNRSAPSEVGPMATARLELRPLGPIDDDSEGDLERRARPGLALGAGYAINVNTDRTRSTTGPTFAGGKTTTFHHAALDAVFKWRGLAVQLEYLWRGASRTHLETIVDGLVVTEHARQASGWVVQASYTFDPPFELVGRISRMSTPAETDPKLAAEVDRLGQEYAVGANYYLNGHQFKVQADWIVRTGTAGHRDRDHLVHVQLDATF